MIVFDLVLPGSDGMKILEELKKEGRQDGIIIISAKDSPEDKITGLQVGAIASQTGNRHGWTPRYEFKNNMHSFSVHF
ncbi:MAG TPA: response regulator [Agriterribacter sp.]|nr:response regulator [Agriterribacter sp.]